MEGSSRLHLKVCGTEVIWTRLTTGRTARSSTRSFNGHYGAWCYLPQLAFLTFDREAEQYLCAAVLRPGRAVASDGAVGLLRRLPPPAAGGVSAGAVSRAARRRVSRPRRSSTSWMPNRGSTTWWRWRRTRCWCVGPSRPWRSRGGRSEVSGETAHVYTDTRYAARTWGWRAHYRQGRTARPGRTSSGLTRTLHTVLHELGRPRTMHGYSGRENTNTEKNPPYSLEFLSRTRRGYTPILPTRDRRPRPGRCHRPWACGPGRSRQNSAGAPENPIRRRPGIAAPAAELLPNA